MLIKWHGHGHEISIEILNLKGLYFIKCESRKKKIIITVTDL